MNELVFAKDPIMIMMVGSTIRALDEQLQVTQAEKWTTSSVNKIMWQKAFP